MRLTTMLIGAGLAVLSATTATPSSASATQGVRVVSIPTPDGGPVAADSYGSGDRAVVLAHGGRFDRSSWSVQATALANAGFRVLAIDFRAAVASREGKQTPCLYEASCLAKDVLAAVRHLRIEGANSVSIVGGSLGGGAAAQATIEAEAGEIDRIVLLAHMLIEQPERMKGRKLFVAAKDDLNGSRKPRLDGIRAQFERASGPKELVVLDGSAHAQAIFETDQGKILMAKILGFLSEP